MIWKIVLGAIAIFIGLVAVRFSMLSNAVKDRLLSNFGRRHYSYTVYDRGSPDLASVGKIQIYKGFFNFDKWLEAADSKAFIKVLQDSSNYDRTRARTGNGLDVSPLTIIFYDAQGVPLGESYLDRDGYVATSPPELITITGYLKRKGFDELQKYVY